MDAEGIGNVAGFTFAQRNAVKALALPLYALGALAALVVPRRSGLWVFGSGPGIGEGALELYAAAREADPSLELRWLAQDGPDLERAQRLGLPAARKTSLRGLWLTLRARVVVVTHGFGDVNRYGIRSAFVVQLWHGIPLKRIQLDSPATTDLGRASRLALVRRLAAGAYRRASSAIRLMPAASEPAAQRLRSAFGLPEDRVVVTGDPRDDVLCRGDETARSASARHELQAVLGTELGSSRLILLAPTWRDGEADPVVPTEAEWRSIGEQLGRSDGIMIVRPHPHSIGDYRSGPRLSPRILLLDTALCQDVTPLLPAVDLLITDYSSIAYDFALTGRPMLFLAPDAEDYAATRGLYQPYADFSGGRHAQSWAELLDRMREADADPRIADGLRERSRRMAAEFHRFTDGRNTERVLAEIRRRLGTGEAA